MFEIISNHNVHLAPPCTFNVFYTSSWCYTYHSETLKCISLKKPVAGWKMKPILLEINTWKYVIQSHIYISYNHNITKGFHHELTVSKTDLFNLIRNQRESKILKITMYLTNRITLREIKLKFKLQNYTQIRDIIGVTCKQFWQKNYHKSRRNNRH